MQRICAPRWFHPEMFETSGGTRSPVPNDHCAHFKVSPHWESTARNSMQFGVFCPLLSDICEVHHLTGKPWRCPHKSPSKCYLGIWSIWSTPVTGAVKSHSFFWVMNNDETQTRWKMMKHWSSLKHDEHLSRPVTHPSQQSYPRAHPTPPLGQRHILSSVHLAESVSADNWVGSQIHAVNGG
jgi:hypothetical protein